MKIALVVHCFFPRHFYGTEAYTLALAKQLIALGHEVTVVSAVPPGFPRQRHFVEEYVHEGVPVISLDKNEAPNTRVRDTYDDPRMNIAHERILRRLAPDVVHVTHLINHTTSILDVAAALGLPTVATFTDFFGFCYTNKLEAADGSLCSGPSKSRANCFECALKAWRPPPGPGPIPFFARAISHPRVRPGTARALAAIGARSEGAVFGFHAADLVRRPDRLAASLEKLDGAIAPSSFLERAYQANGFSRPLRLSRFGIDIGRAPKPATDSPKTRLGFVGQIASHKGIHVLLEAMRAARRPNLGLTIWGDATIDRAYHARLVALANGLDVTFAGTVPAAELPRVFAGLDALVIPSTWYENSPLILLQSLATHTPVIASDVAGLTEFFEDGVSGFAFPRGDAGALAALIGRLADAPDTLRAMTATTAYDRGTADMVRDVVSLYSDVLVARRVGQTPREESA
jgi:glycosyltransferase involved in cell wall biosynthesis